MWDFSKFYNHYAIVEQNGLKMTYEELEASGNEVTDIVGKRCLVIILCKNSVGSLIAYTSFLNNGIVPMLLPSNIEEKLLGNIIRSYEPNYIWLPKEKVELFHNTKILYEKYDYVLIYLSKVEKNILNDELALLLSTSGSVGSPKMVRLSYNNILSNTESIIDYLKISKTDRPITTLPIYYTYGLSIINTHLMVGATLLLTDKWIMEPSFWHFFREENATSISGVPFMFEVLKKIHFFNMKLPSLKTITQAGGKLLVQLQEEFANYAELNDIKFYIMYGQTEATARMSYLPFSQV